MQLRLNDLRGLVKHVPNFDNLSIRIRQMLRVTLYQSADRDLSGGLSLLPRHSICEFEFLLPRIQIVC